MAERDVYEIAERIVAAAERTERAFYEVGDGSPEWLAELAEFELACSVQNAELMARHILAEADIAAAGGAKP